MYTIITRDGCVYCDKAKKLMTSRGDDYREVLVTSPDMNELYKALGYKTYPTIVGIGGYDELVKFYEGKEAK